MSYQLLFNQIQNDLNKIQRAVQENEALVATLETIKDNPVAYNGIIGGIAMNIQSFYTGIERILSAIAKQIDGDIYSGDRWHQELLIQMSEEIVGKRPAVLRRNTLEDLQDFLKFRHVVRNSYSYTLDAKRVLEAANRLSMCYTNFAYDCLSLKRLLVDSST